MNPQQALHYAQSLGLSMNYGIDTCRISPSAGSIVELSVDDDTADYIRGSQFSRHGPALTWIHRNLRGLFSDFDINGLLGTYPMHVLSRAQWGELLGEHRRGRLLDVGSGRGDVTRCLAAHFDEVTTVETSRGMARRLSKEGFRVRRMDLALTPLDDVFDAVSLLNVLDRCDRPLSLLGAARSLLETGGLLIIALVLPYRPFVYDRGGSRSPTERLPINSDSFEQAASEFIELCLLALGLEILVVSRAPYLSGGDASAPLYELDDLIVVARALGPPPPILGR